MDERTNSFGYWLRRRRKALDFTQEALAQSVACSRFTIRKIEADERRPSRRLAERLADKLAIPSEERGAFLDIARAVTSVGGIALGNAPVSRPLEVEQAEANPFVGRGTEYGLLAELLTKVTGGGYAALIEGEAGIGKSRLMREVARSARAQGLWTFATNCYEIERAIPYQPVIDLVTQLLELAPLATLRKLPPVSLAEIAALVPAVRQRVAVPVLATDFPEARQGRLFRAIAQLFETLAGGRPVVVSVDNLQWADDASAQFLHHFARHAAGHALLVLYAYRDDETDAHDLLTELVASLRREPHTRHLSLQRLRLADTQELVEGLGDADFASRLHCETDGNPFFLTLMLHALRAGEISRDHAGELPLPEALRASVRARLAHVPAGARATLDVAAVLGRRFDFEHLLAVTKGSHTDLLDALEMLVRRRMLREEPDGYYDFSHDKLREVAYREIGGARRMLLHRAIAEALEHCGEGEPHERNARLAEHYERAHVWGKTMRHMALAAESSQKLSATRDALRWLDRAIELAAQHPEAASQDELIDMHDRRGRARAQAGLTEGAVADIRLVAAAARARGDRALERDTLIQLGMTYRRGDDYGQAVAYLTQALAECRAANSERDTADTLYHLGTVFWSDGRNREAITCHDEAVNICERLGLTDVIAVQAYHGRGESHFNSLEPVVSIGCFNRSIELARGIGDKSYESENLAMAAYAYTGQFGVGDYRQANAHFESAFEIAQAADLQWHMGPMLLGIDYVRACLGRYGAAWTGMMRTLGWLESVKLKRYQVVAHVFMVHLLLDLGLNEKALEFSERGLALARDTKMKFWRPHIEANLAIASMRLGHLDVAPALEEVLRQTRENGERHYMVRCLEGLAELALRRGDAEQCLAVATELLAHAQGSGVKELAAQARRWSGEALAITGRREAAVEHLGLAAATAEEIGRVRLAWDATAALARIGGSNAHRVRADALAAQIRSSLAGSELESTAIALR